MTKRSRNLSFGLLLVGVSAIGFYFQHFLEMARSSEAKATIIILSTSEEAYFKGHGEYTSSFDALGFHPEGNLRYSFYLGSENLAPEVRRMIAQKDLPLAASDDYQILAVPLNTSVKTYWKLHKGGKIEEVSLVHPY